MMYVITINKNNKNLFTTWIKQKELDAIQDQWGGNIFGSFHGFKCKDIKANWEFMLNRSLGTSVSEAIFKIANACNMYPDGVFKIREWE